MNIFKTRVVRRSLLQLGILLSFSAVAYAQDPVGEWNLQSDAQGQITNFTLTITKVGEALKGTVVSEQYGKEDLADLKFENGARSEEHTSELQSQSNLVCRLLLEKKKKNIKTNLNT